MIGLATMGRNLALNLLDHGANVVAWNLESELSSKLARQYTGNNLKITQSLSELVRQLSPPRLVIMMIQSGKPIDDVLDQIIPILDAGDIIADGGNSHYKDTMRRHQSLGHHQIDYVGLGVSGGEHGARHGPSIMAGASDEAWLAIKDVMELIAAKSHSIPCAIRMGNNGAGHFVKMVHNGIEYADMQLIAETYDLLKRGNQLETSAIANIFSEWNEGPLESFLIELTALVLRKKEAGEYLVDKIRDGAEQKGTGRWTVQAALEFGVAVPTIAAAVDTRSISSNYEDRKRLSREKHPITESLQPLKVGKLADALYVAKLLAYAQGMQLIKTGSEAHQWDIRPDLPLRAWTGGCIIRARLLNDLISAYEEHGQQTNLFVVSAFTELIRQKQQSLREVVAYGLQNGIALPAFSASLVWLALVSSEQLPTNLTQAQRDAFGAHGFKKIDDHEDGIHHGDWLKP